MSCSCLYLGLCLSWLGGNNVGGSSRYCVWLQSNILGGGTREVDLPHRCGCMNRHRKYASTLTTPIFGGRSVAEVEMSVLWEERGEGGTEPWVNFNISEQENAGQLTSWLFSCLVQLHRHTPTCLCPAGLWSAVHSHSQCDTVSSCI